VEYEISEPGRSLAPLFSVLATWCEANLHRVDEARQHYDRSGGRLSS